MADPWEGNKIIWKDVLKNTRFQTITIAITLSLIQALGNNNIRLEVLIGFLICASIKGERPK